MACSSENDLMMSGIEDVDEDGSKYKFDDNKTDRRAKALRTIEAGQRNVSSLFLYIST